MSKVQTPDAAASIDPIAMLPTWREQLLSSTARVEVLDAEDGHLTLRGNLQQLAANDDERAQEQRCQRRLQAVIALGEKAEQEAAAAAAQREWQRWRAGGDAECKAYEAAARSALTALLKVAADMTAVEEQAAALGRLAITNPVISRVAGEAMRRVLQAFVNATPPGTHFPTRTPFPLPEDPLETLLSDLSTEFDRANPPPGAAE